jgi:NAD(P)-dependent dehydrogenase (short-subunit alcohol dehydrogenase family)
MGVTTAVPIGSLYNMSKFALEGLTEGLYYELKPLNIELRLVEQGGSSGNNFKNNIVWNTSDEIKDYDIITAKVKTAFERTDNSKVDDPQDIVSAIAALATGESKQFRTLVGESAQGLVALRKDLPIEEYLEKISLNFQ